MCDCYEGKCEGCGAEVPIHIGDFSAAREHVKVWCTSCSDRFLVWLLHGMSRQGKVFVDSVPGRGAGHIFWVEDPRSIHVND